MNVGFALRGGVWRFAALALIVAAWVLMPATVGAHAATASAAPLSGSVAPGIWHTLTIRQDASLWGWGRNSEGQVGIGNEAPIVFRTRVDGGTDWAYVSAGEYFSHAVRDDGTLWGWGDNSAGQLGDGTTTTRLVPTRVGSSQGWASISSGWEHSVALKSDGTLWFWGRVDPESGPDVTVPTQVAVGSTWRMVSAGWQYSTAIKSDGSLWAWGSNGNGNLGNGTTDDAAVPTQTGTDTDWRAVSAGSDHTLALKSDGSLWAWGGNYDGGLGTGTTTPSLMPTRVGGDTDWRAISAGTGYSLAIKNDGSLWAWGLNSTWELGDGTTTQRNSPTRIGTSNDWVDVFAIKSMTGRSFATKTDGSLWGWGDNDYGALGDGGTRHRETPYQIWPARLSSYLSTHANRTVCTAAHPVVTFTGVVTNHTGRAISAGKVWLVRDGRVLGRFWTNTKGVVVASASVSRYGAGYYSLVFAGSAYYEPSSSKRMYISFR